MVQIEVDAEVAVRRDEAVEAGQGRVTVRGGTFDPAPVRPDVAEWEVTEEVPL